LPSASTVAPRCVSFRIAFSDVSICPHYLLVP
jgi:hypothetical protein